MLSKKLKMRVTILFKVQLERGRMNKKEVVTDNIAVTYKNP